MQLGKVGDLDQIAEEEAKSKSELNLSDRQEYCPSGDARSLGAGSL